MRKRVCLVVEEPTKRFMAFLDRKGLPYRTRERRSPSSLDAVVIQVPGYKLGSYDGVVGLKAWTKSKC